MTTMDIHALAGPYVLNAVSEEERIAFSRHLAQCDVCSAEIYELSEIAGRLADGAWSVPPPRLRAQVLAEVARTRQLPPRRPDRETALIPSPWRRRAAYTLAAGILAVAAGSTTYAVMDSRLDRQSQQTVAAQAEAQRIQQVLSAPDAVMRSAPVVGGGRMAIVMSPSQNAGVVFLNDLTAPGADHTYQLWLVDGTTPVSAGVLADGHSGGTRLISGVVGKDVLALTQEPAGGSKAPSAPAISDIPMT
ncbi:anti-sigma-K factor RskA [Allocatelliglobosispora scoriae]|uniref:Regulator of SigK n=1 Tax=Allocatelliglobosispora scoriae TaxID=643052 RepID=A0A841BPD1_9ACTN|nr:anti-sigma factor [Allocatelliglobosispora scoriae]MBB5869535.1 anti-sigma-K factor RskA [Allocatelliglobosispora scoriae]